MKTTVPATTFIGVSIIVVSLLYITTIIKTVPCGTNITDIFLSNFIHTNIYHLAANMFALYSLSRVEVELDTKGFVGLIVFLLVLNTATEAVIHNIIPGIPCSVGFSGVLIGVTVWDMVANKDFDWYLVSSVVAVVIAQTYNVENVSILGHIVGAISGAIGGWLWAKTKKKSIDG